jgi:hypothetical protein
MVSVLPMECCVLTHSVCSNEEKIRHHEVDLWQIFWACARTEVLEARKHRILLR